MGERTKRWFVVFWEGFFNGLGWCIAVFLFLVALVMVRAELLR